MYESKSVTLRGDPSLHQSQTNLQTLSCASLTPTFGWESGLAASQVLSVQAPQQIQDVMDQFMGVFQTPSGLPPVRSRDHTIMLQPGVTSISVRPYRYPQASKTTMEQMVAEMLQTGIIRPSKSPFSCPVLLVKKKDGTSRFCVDYRV